jgi:hypothetical protein
MSILPPGHEDATVNVDVAGLTDLANKLEAELDKQLRPYIGQLTVAYRQGVGFAEGVPGYNSRVARAHYANVLAQVVNQLQSLAWGTAVLADAARRIATRYSTADGLAAATIDGVNAELTAASRALAMPAALGLVSESPSVTINGMEAQ